MVHPDGQVNVLAVVPHPRQSRLAILAAARFLPLQGPRDGAEEHDPPHRRLLAERPRQIMSGQMEIMLPPQAAGVASSAVRLLDLLGFLLCAEPVPIVLTV